MREILFRGKSKNSNEWVQGGILQTENRAEIYVPHDSYGAIAEPPFCDVEIVEVDPETVGQYTGLTDRNGKKIFEGDILKGVQDDLFIMKWHRGQFIAENVKDWLFAFKGQAGEVVGNIHDNPELLEGGR